MSKNVKYIPKKSVKLSRDFVYGIWECAAESERIKLLGELYRNPIEFLEVYFTEKQKKKILEELI